MTVYQIHTTSELDETVYLASKVRIMGSFVEFNPFEIRRKLGNLENKNDAVFILPERVIKRILKIDVTEEMAEQLKKSHKL